MPDVDSRPTAESPDRARRTAVVIGASRGLGREFVRQLASQGTRVFAGVRSPSSVKDLVCAGVTVLEADYDRPFTLTAAAETVGRSGTGLDLLINCGAVNRVPGERASAVKGPIAELRGEALAAMFVTNTIGPVLAVQAFWPILQKQRRSTVVNLTTQRALFSQVPSVGSIGYAASKAALNMATRIMAAEFGVDGPMVVAVDPGWVATDMGGPSAPLQPHDVVKHILGLLESLPGDASGALFRHDGERLSW